MKVVVSSREFKTFISSVSNINRSTINLTIKEDCIETLAVTEDNASISLYARANTLQPVNLEGGEPKVICIKDINKVQQILNVNDADSFEFEVKGNKLVFCTGKIADARLILEEPKKKKGNKRFTAEWFKSLTPAFTCHISKNEIKTILQGHSFADSSEKVYFYEKDGKVVAELNDYEKTNIDSITITIGEPTQGHIGAKVIIGVGSLAKMYVSDVPIKMELAPYGETSKYDLLLFTMENDNVYTRYFFNQMAR